MMTSTYGRRVPEWDCEDVREVYGLMQEFSESAAPGAFLADMIPPLAKIPVWMQWWRKRALKYQDRQTKIWMKYWTDLNKQIAEKRAPDCFVKQFIETDYKTQGISDLQGAFLAGCMLASTSLIQSSTDKRTSNDRGGIRDDQFFTQQLHQVSRCQSLCASSSERRDLQGCWRLTVSDLGRRAKSTVRPRHD